MILTLESYKNNINVLSTLKSILDEIKVSIENNPFKQLILGEWVISKKPLFKDGFESTIIFSNRKKDEDINITFTCIDELTENDIKYKINSIVLYQKKGTKEEIIKIDNYIYNICNELLQLIEKNNENI